METRKSILIVEDDYSIRSALREALEFEGYPVVTAQNGREALDILFNNDKPALVFLDIAMPIMGGHQLLKFMKSDGDLRSIPVVVTSASYSEDEVVGANLFMKKPMDLKDILEVAHTHCG